MTLMLERPPLAQPAVRRRFSIMATIENRYLILDGDGRPVPTVARGGEPTAGVSTSSFGRPGLSPRIARYDCS